MKHSPGPWSACHNGKCSCKQIWTPHYPVAVVEAGEWGDDYWEAELKDGKPVPVRQFMAYGSIPEEEAIANAKLITAAPDLLAAVEMLCNGLEWNIENNPTAMNESDAEALQAGRAALALAKNGREDTKKIDVLERLQKSFEAKQAQEGENDG